ncbi:MAG: integrase [Pirellulaceae bacterium]|nr:MAG: integrase [Pirellulaceae bacterium]
MKGRSPQTKKIRCAIYTRKSTEEGLEQDFNSLDAQREAGEAYIKSQAAEGWTLLPERYDDGGFSGGSLDRPALKRLLADIEAGKVDCVVVYKVDRLSRSLLDFARLMETFERHGASFVSVTQQFNTATSMGRLVLNVLLSFAQFEREIIGERIRDKLAAMRRKGKWAGGVPILGYDVDRSNGSPRLVINAREAAQVRDIFRLYLSHGSLLAVVNELARRGWRTKTWRTKKGKTLGGRLFDKGSLYSLLTNPLYIGQVRHKGDVYPGEHEPIVEVEVFQQVQAMLQSNGRSGGVLVRNRHGALLKGLLFCKACGRAMTHSFTCRGQRRYRYYTCTRAIKSGRKACPSGSLPAGEIERVVIDHIRAITTDPRLRAEVLREAQAQIEGELAELVRERRGLEQELSRYHAEIRKLCGGGPAIVGSGMRLAELNDRVMQAETRLQELRRRIEEQERERLTAKEIDAAFEDFDNVWNALSPREQAQVLALLVARVEFDSEDSTVAISFHPTAIMSLARQSLGGVA